MIDPHGSSQESQREFHTWKAVSWSWLALALGIAVTALRLLLAHPLQFCGTPDACYYLGMAQNLGSGQGFHARFLYDFQLAHLSVPNTGIEYWRPGVSFLLLAARPFGEISLFSSLVITTLAGVLLAAAAWHIAIRTTGNAELAFSSFALCLLSVPVWVGSSSPDSALFYGAAVAWFLALFTEQSQGPLAEAIALLCVALAYLIRNDAVLLLVPLLAVLCRRVRTARRTPPPAFSFTQTPAYAVVILVCFFAALAPMHLLYHAVLGTAFPSGTAQVLFLDNLGDFEKYGSPVTLHSLLATGIAHLLSTRWVTLATVLYRLAALMVGYPALIFLLAWRRRSRSAIPGSDQRGDFISRDLLGPCTFGLVVLFIYTLVMPAIGQFSALRSAVGLLPFLLVYALLGVRQVSRDRHAARWLTAAVIGANAIAGFAQVRRDISGSNDMGALDHAKAQALAALHADPARSIIMVNNPVQFSVTTGYTTVALPNNGLQAIASAAHTLHASYLVVDSDSPPAPRAVLEQQLHVARFLDEPAEHVWILQLAQNSTETPFQN